MRRGTRSAECSVYMQSAMVTRSLYLKQETQPLLTNRATHLCKSNGVADLLKTRPPYICYHAEFSRSALKDVGINTGKHLKLRSAVIPTP